MRNDNKTLKWLKEYMNDKIIIDDEIIYSNKAIRGVYGIFVYEGSREYCAYVGRTSNIYGRFFVGRNAHLVKIKVGQCSNIAINKALSNDNAIIKIKILKKVNCHYDDYHKDMQRLASCENYFIDKYQKLNQCLEQLPDGSNMKSKVWESERALKISMINES